MRVTSALTPCNGVAAGGDVRDRDHVVAVHDRAQEDDVVVADAVAPIADLVVAVAQLDDRAPAQIDDHVMAPRNVTVHEAAVRRKSQDHALHRDHAPAPTRFYSRL